MVLGSLRTVAFSLVISLPSRHKFGLSVISTTQKVFERPSLMSAVRGVRDFGLHRAAMIVRPGVGSVVHPADTNVIRRGGIEGVPGTIRRDQNAVRRWTGRTQIHRVPSRSHFGVAPRVVPLD